MDQDGTGSCTSHGSLKPGPIGERLIVLSSIRSWRSSRNIAVEKLTSWHNSLVWHFSVLGESWKQTLAAQRRGKEMECRETALWVTNRLFPCGQLSTSKTLNQIPNSSQLLHTSPAARLENVQIPRYLGNPKVPFIHEKCQSRTRKLEMSEWALLKCCFLHLYKHSESVD